MSLIRKLMMKVVRVSNGFIFLMTAILVVVSSALITFIEPNQFETFYDGLWWVMTTVTTVGYGDYSPATGAGRWVAIFLYIFGIGLIGVVIGKIIDGFSVFRKKREEGDIVYSGKGHYIIIGWSKKAYYAVKEIIDTKPEAEIVIIDDLEKAPYLKEHIHYIRGNASAKETVLKANVSEAEAVLIFADDRIQDVQLVDGKTLLVASTVETCDPNVHIVVEIMEEEHIKNFVHVNVNEFVFSTQTVSTLAVRSAFTKGISGFYGQLISRSHGDDLFQIPLSEQWKTYRDAFDDLLKRGATLVADRQNLSINRMLDEVIPPDAELFVICDKETYKQIEREYQS
ncbi:ion transporter [Pontibacillus halophilus JSM 076056 = DSM 19796]|uniref:Ion transporter n=1 Tax=Pontibacillus halophilus JSM 076056 = DSM 19796 TaxID=1385510 RepID=A0A0A5G8G3_9BACI|nr:potassium channel family protein [Pontibacillus halophilus]KGX89426.1 ion transporter [Pontibacillus halophilus JSM 076056 = DSM 19796]